MPYFMARVVLHGASVQDYIDFHALMAAQGLFTSFTSGNYRYHMPDATYFRRSTAALGDVKVRVEAALANTNRFTVANPDSEEPIDDTYSYFLNGPSASHEHAGLKREILPLAQRLARMTATKK